MSDVSITAEDRERLAKSKFKEWFDECLEGSFEDAFEKATAKRRTKKTDPSEPAPDSPDEPSDPQPTAKRPPERRRSLLETCLSQTFGF